MAGQGKRDSTADSNLDFTDAGGNRFSLKTHLFQGKHYLQVNTLTHEHQKVHDGDFYSTGYYLEGVADDGYIDLLIQTPATDTLHTYIKLSGGGDVTFEVYEGTTFSAAGTTVTPVNHNRSSSNTCGCTVTHTPTVSSLGTQLWQEYLPGGSGGLTPGTVQGVSTEQVVFDKDTNYLLRLYNRAGTAQSLQVTASYYPVTIA